MREQITDHNALAGPHARKVIQAVEAAGGNIRLVGGRVRDLLLKRTPGDTDLATDLVPEQTLEALQEAGFRTLDFGIKHGTVAALIGGEAIEVTSLRKDVRTDGRHAEVVFGKSWREDAERRDFTLNALYADKDGNVYDPLGTGVRDLQAGRIRFAGDAEKRIQEDYLRILRYFRFQAQFGREHAMDCPEGEYTLEACRANRAGLENLSRERITQEMLKILAAKNPWQALDAARNTQVLEMVLGEVDPDSGKNLSLLRQLEETHCLQGDWAVRWMCVDRSPKTSGMVLSREQKRILGSVRKIRKTLTEENPSVLVLGHEHGQADTARALLMHMVLDGSPRDNLDKDLQTALEGETAVFPVSAGDFLALGMEEGPEIGLALKKARKFWISKDLLPGKDEVLRNSGFPKKPGAPQGPAAGILEATSARLKTFKARGSPAAAGALRQATRILRNGKIPVMLPLHPEAAPAVRLLRDASRRAGQEADWNLPALMSGGAGPETLQETLGLYATEELLDQTANLLEAGRSPGRIPLKARG